MNFLTEETIIIFFHQILHLLLHHLILHHLLLHLLLGCPPPPPPSSDFFNIPNVPRIDEFLNNNDFNFEFSNSYVPPAPDTPLLRGFAGKFFPNRPSTAKISSNVRINITQTISSDRLIGELERVVEEENQK